MDKRIRPEKVDTMKDIVINSFYGYSTKTAIIEKINGESIEFSYNRLRKDILTFGTALYETYKIRNKKIAVIGENSYKWYVSYMATVCGLGIIVPLDKELPSEEIVGLINRADCDVIIYSKKKKEKIHKIKDQLKKDIMYINMEIDEHNKEEYSFDKLIQEGDALMDLGKKEYRYLDVDVDAFSILLFTSGTTSKSKGVMLSQKNIMANVAAAKDIYTDILSQSFLSFLPMHHTLEFSGTYTAVLASGGTVIVCEGLKYIISNLNEFRPDGFFAVPLLLDNIKSKIEKSIAKQGKTKLISLAIKFSNVLRFFNIDIRRKLFKQIHETFGKRLKYLIVGGAPISKETIIFLEDIGFEVFQGYGLTETAPLIAITPLTLRTIGSVGKPIKDVEVKIAGDKDEGEIMAKGPNVMLGYYDNKEETDKVLKDGWFYTGDIGRFDINGNLFISGRTKNVIVTANGKNIYPEELEFLINKIDYVSESLVYGKGDIKDPEIAVKVRVDYEYLKENKIEDLSDENIHKMLLEEIKKINKKLVLYKYIKSVEIKKDEFIKTTTMKIKRNAEIKNK